MKKIFQSILLFVFALSLCAAAACSTGKVKVTGVSLDKAALSLTVGGTATLKVSVLPDDAENKSVEWSSSDSSVAKVENGTVTALKEGAATVTVKTKDGGKKADCAVTVAAAKLTETQWDKVVSDTLSAENFTLKVVQQSGEEKYETDAKYDKPNGRIWSKNEPSVSWSERYIVKTQSEVSDYTLDKDSGMWNVSSDDAGSFEDYFGSWEGIGDGVKQMTVDLIPTAEYKDISFENGEYVFDLSFEEISLSCKAKTDGNHFTEITMSMEVETDDEGNKSLVTIEYFFSDFGTTRIAIPADLPQA